MAVFYNLSVNMLKLQQGFIPHPLWSSMPLKISRCLRRRTIEYVPIFKKLCGPKRFAAWPVMLGVPPLGGLAGNPMRNYVACGL